MKHPFIFSARFLQASTAAALGFFVATPTWAINKCIESGGKIIYTDEPCTQGTKALQVQDAPAVTDTDRANATKRAQQMRSEVSDIRKREAEELKTRQEEAANAQKELDLKAQQQAKAKEDERNAQLQRSGESYYAPFPNWNWGRRKSYDDSMLPSPQRPANAPHNTTGMGPNPSLNPNSSLNSVPNGGLTPMPPVPQKTAPVSPPKGNPGPPKTMYVTPQDRAAQEKAAQQP